jgi:hypothetical protein
LDGVGAFVRIHGFHVGVVTSDVVVEQYAVSAEDVARHGAYSPRTRCCVELGQRGVLKPDPALGLELGHAKADQLHAGDVGHHVRELVLDELKSGNAPTELFALFGVS